MNYKTVKTEEHVEGSATGKFTLKGRASGEVYILRKDIKNISWAAWISAGALVANTLLTYFKYFHS